MTKTAVKDKNLKKIIDKEFNRMFKENVEQKFHNHQQVNQAIPATGTTYDIQVIAQGLGDANRIGDALKVDGIDIRGKVDMSSNSTTNSLRVILVQMHDLYDVTSGLPWYPDILNSTYSSGSNATLSPRNMDKMELFRVLSDRTYSVSAQKPRVDFHIAEPNIKLRKTQYEAASSSYRSEGLYLFAVSDDGTALSANYPYLSFVSQLRYRDA